MAGSTLLGLWAKQAARKESAGTGQVKEEKPQQSEAAAKAATFACSARADVEKIEAATPPGGKENDKPKAAADPSRKSRELAGNSAGKMNLSPATAVAVSGKTRGYKGSVAVQEATPSSTEQKQVRAVLIVAITLSSPAFFPPSSSFHLPPVPLFFLVALSFSYSPHPSLHLYPPALLSLPPPASSSSSRPV